MAVASTVSPKISPQAPNVLLNVISSMMNRSGLMNILIFYLIVLLDGPTAASAPGHAP